MDTSKLDFYTQNVNQLLLKRKSLKKTHTIVSFARLFSALVFLLSWFIIYPKHQPTGIILSIIMFLFFFILLKYHKKLENKIHETKLLININKNEAECCNGNFSNFEPGNQHINPAHNYSYDIDLFGTGSLFQYLNRTSTRFGNNKLAQMLNGSPLSNDQILQNQKAINELNPLVNFRNGFMVRGQMFDSSVDEEAQINAWLKMTPFFKNQKLLTMVLIALPFITIGIGAFAITGFVQPSVFWLMAMFNLAITGLRNKQFNYRYQVLSSCHVNLKKMGQLLVITEQQKFESQKLNSIQNNLFSNKTPSSMQIKSLTKILGQLDTRNNFLLAIVLNALFLWDWQYMHKADKWKQTHQFDYNKWLLSIGELDALISLANYAFNNPGYCYPQLSNLPVFEANSLGHPLIHANKRVTNSFCLKQNSRFAIVTGANMAGKSTFLRTVAVNIILGGIGAPVCASEFIFMPVDLFTSMRNEDSLQKNESYFFAELKRLQNIALQLQNNKPVFIILDEILRGTNSTDKQKGSIGFVEKIAKTNAYGLIATHDLQLAMLSQKYTNIFNTVCFEVEIKNNTLLFNYKLHNGITQNMNASFLMKKMGIID